MPLCRLCQKDRVLCESHIVPKFLYEDLRNTKRQIMGVTGHGKRGWAAIQDGAKEHLLCECCEQHFNIHFETPFRTYWIESSPIPDPWVDENPRWIRPNYNSFKLFHLSVLFRASVTTLPMFSAVDLGIHEERIRLMLLNCDAGNYYEYPVGGYAVVHHRTREIIRLISQAQAFKVGGRLVEDRLEVRVADSATANAMREIERQGVVRLLPPNSHQQHMSCDLDKTQVARNR